MDLDVSSGRAEAYALDEPVSLRTKVFDGLRAVGLSTASIAVLKLVQLIVLARILAPDSFGVMTMAAVVMGLLGHLAEIGGGAVVVHRQSLSARELNALFWVGLTIGAVAMLLVIVTSSAIAHHFSEPRLVAVLWVMSCTLVVNSIGLPYRSLLERDLAFRTVATIELLGVLIGVTVAVSMAYLGIGLMSLAWGLLSTSIVNASLYVISGWRRWRPQMAFSTQSLAPNFAFGANLSGQRLLNYVTANTDYFLIGTFLGSEALGFYSVAYNLANLPSSHVNALLGRVSYPALARMQEDVSRMRTGYLKLQEISGLVNAPLLVGLAALANVVIPVALGDSWQPAVPLLQMLCLVGLGRAIGGTVGPLLLARGRPDLGLRWSFLVVVLQTPLLYVGLLMGGALGVATGFVIAQALLVILNYVILIRTLIGPCLRSYALAVLPPLAIAALMGGIVLVAGATLASHMKPIPILVIQIAVGATLYIGSLRVFRPSLLHEAKEAVRYRAIS